MPGNLDFRRRECIAFMAWPGRKPQEWYILDGAQEHKCS